MLTRERKREEERERQRQRQTEKERERENASWVNRHKEKKIDKKMGQKDRQPIISKILY